MNEAVLAALTELPGHMQVGPFRVRIETWEGNEAHSESKFGTFSSVTLKIRISAGIASPELLIDTFLHEVLHALWWLQGIQDGDDEERTVRSMATGMVMLFRDNPWLPEWVTATMERGSSAAERRSHNPQVAGSIPAPATKIKSVAGGG